MSLLSCGGSDEASAPVRALSLVSFNAALGVGLAPYPEQRLDAIEADLPDLDADVVCLQEVWEPQNIERLVAALSNECPFSHRSVLATAAGGGCSESEAAALSSCLSDNCAGIGREGLPLCAITNCAETFTQVSMECQQCIAANQSAADVENLTMICASAGSAEVAAFSDQTGLALLSRLPLERKSYAAFESALGDRGLLSARLHTDFMGDVDVHCTHLAATLSDVPYTGAHGSWQGERLRQIEQMIERVAEIQADGNDGGGAILIGDMNCGPGTPLARAASPDAFQRLTDAGFIAPYADLDGRCTFCENNPLNGAGTDAEEGALIDHVLVSSRDELAFTAERVFDDPIAIAVDGVTIDTARSDHYGVSVRASAGESSPPGAP